MTPEDLFLLLVGSAVLLLLFAFGGAIADSAERREARNRNHVSRR